MFKIDSQAAVPVADALDAPVPGGGYFTDGNPQTATPATVVSSNWLNAVQDEIVNVILAAGIALVKGTNNQLLLAIQYLIENFQSVTTFVIANNQLVAANVTDLVFDKTKCTSAIIECEVYRKDGAQETKQTLVMKAHYKPVANTWALLGPNEDGDDCGVTFSIVPATGQVQYVSTNFAGGGYVGTLKPKVKKFTV